MHIPYTCTIYMYPTYTICIYHIHLPCTYTMYMHHVHVPCTCTMYQIHVPSKKHQRSIQGLDLGLIWAWSILLRDNCACGAFSSGQLGLRRFIPFLNRIFGRNFIDVSTNVLANIYFFHIQSLVLTRGADSPRKSVVDPQKIVNTYPSFLARAMSILNIWKNFGLPAHYYSPR